MNALWEAFRVAFRAIASSGGRSLLTILGVLIGTAAVVMVVALGESARSRVNALVESLGSNVIFVLNAPGQGKAQVERKGYRLSVRDAQAIRREASGLRGITVLASTRAAVQSAFGQAQLEVVGGSTDYVRVRNFQIASGRDLSTADFQSNVKVCLLGASAAQRLFGASDPVGQSVRIARHRFEVIGLLSPKGQTPFGQDDDETVLLPIRSFQSRIAPGRGDRVDEIIASAFNAEAVAALNNQIDQLLLERRHTPPDGKRDFRLMTQGAFRQGADQITQVLSLVLACVAAISLFVGGVGVMNILLVSVHERQREIGTRLAIGATPSDIRRQFLIEAISLTTLGGILGLALACAGLVLLEQRMGWPIRLNLAAASAALATSLGLGLVFGALPAHRAANMDPIDALRHD